MCARLTTHGWPKDLLKIQTPIRIHLCRNFTKCGEPARPPRPTLKLQVTFTQRAAPATLPGSTSRTPFCLPRCFSSPAHQESLSSAGCVLLHSLLLWRYSRLPLCGRRCFRDEGICKLAP